MLDCFQQLRIRRAIAKKNRNLVGHGFFRVGQFIRQDRQSLGDGIPSSRKWDVDWWTRGGVNRRCEQMAQVVKGDALYANQLPDPVN